jgi:hypothetical protein
VSSSTLKDDEASKQGARAWIAGSRSARPASVNNIIPDWNDLVYRKQ